MGDIGFPAFAIASALVRAGCTATQVRMNATQMIDNVAELREEQVLRNISAAVNDHDFVPSEIFLGQGTATVQSNVSAGLKLPRFDFSAPTRELDPTANTQWTSTWFLAPVTSADDLRRLRNLYALVTSTNDQYDGLQAYFDEHPGRRREGR